MAEPQTIKPQPGPQEQFLSSPADIVVYGGAAGGGKSYGLLLDPLRYIDNPKFGAVIFRRTYPEITGEEGLWDEASELYSHLGASSNRTDLKFTFPSGATIGFAHLQHEKDKFSYKGAQIAYLGFDELTSFTRSQFFYMLSRNRSVSGIKPCVRATTNPDAESWVAEFIHWWIDQETGYPIEERAGKLRYFVRENNEYYWGDTKAEVRAKAGHLLEQEHVAPEVLIKSLTFIPADVYDNKILLQKDPAYLANLMMQDKVEKERLLGGNWKVKPSAGMYFSREDIEVVEPRDVPRSWTTTPSRHWDLAGTEPSEENPDPDYTAGSKFAEKSGIVYWIDCRLTRKAPADVEQTVKNTASQDGRETPQYIEQEPGQSGKGQVRHYARNVLKGYTVKGARPTGDKVTRASAASAACGRGEIKMVRGPWNEQVLDMLESFPSESAHDDPVDTLSQFWEERMVSGDTRKPRRRPQTTSQTHHGF